MKTDNMKVGDKIKVKSAARWGWITGWRVITGFWGENHEPTIRCNGTNEFFIHRHEVIDHEAR